MRRARELEPERVLFLDEFGTHLGDCLRYGYAPKGTRATSFAPDRARTHVTLTMAMGLRGIVAPFAWLGATNDALFEGYVRQVLVPQLRVSDVLLLDRLHAHLIPEVRQLVRRAGGRLRRLPSCSPDFNPIEECGAKVKQLLRKQHPMSVEAIYEAIGTSLHQVSESDIAGWFHDRAWYLFPPADLY